MIISFFFQYVIQTRRKSVRRNYYADNCYDCVENIFYPLTDNSFDMKLSEIIFYLKTIQEMNFYPINSLVLKLGLESRAASPMTYICFSYVPIPVQNFRI